MALVVPIAAQPRRGEAPQAPPDEPWALMAAAQMHSEGRLVQTAMNTEGFRRSPNVEDRQGETSKQADRRMVDDLQRQPEGDFQADPQAMSSSLAKDLGSEAITAEALRQYGRKLKASK